MSPLSSVWEELRRRHVVRVGVAYVVAAVAVASAAEVFLPGLGAPQWAVSTVLALIVLGLPLALALAWAYDVTPTGIERTRPTELPDESARADTHEGRKSIVVLPFDNMSPEPTDAYFSEGLTEEIITRLSHLRSLRVISRSSAMALKGTQKDVRTIGRELDVQYVLEGSVRKAGANLRITAQLIDAGSDEHVWADRYDGTLDDVFQIQEDASEAIVSALRVQLSPDEKRRLTERPLRDLRAYECYLRARHEFYTLSAGSEDRTIDLIDEAIDLEGESDVLYAWKGFALFQLVNSMSRPPETFKKLLDEARNYAESALAIDPASSLGHTVMGYVCVNAGDPQKGIRHFAEALRQDPDNTDALLYVGFQSAIGGWDHAGSQAALLRQRALDPLTPIASGSLVWLLWANGEFGAAAEEFQDFARGAEAGKSPFRVFIAYLLAAAGDLHGAVRLTDHMIADSPEHVLTALARFLRHAWLGEPEAALASVTPELSEGARWDDMWPLMMAAGYALCDDLDGAFRWLGHAIDYGFTSSDYLREHDPFLAALRADERFDRLMERADRTAASISQGIRIEELIGPSQPVR